ncbi:MAG: HNH endonuclease domain-containing protein [Zhengella sp.]|uniref:HNH endonuclease domain-containing protein n=1 Tax=Zhengella sp. TaxID=2282762 RepID=UPI001D7FF506|nr:HNH endonuclease [Notoacmeibacter sp.]MCC0027699.1 HNH endonuclease [Brucellaceae bacterium]
MVLRFAFDLGTGSIGMAVSRTGPDGGLDPVFSGARILPARPPGQIARLGMRRKLARYRKRRKARRRAFASMLRGAGLLPPPGPRSNSLFARDPYLLRAEALDKRISLHAFGRVLMHLHQRRGRPVCGNLPQADTSPLGARTQGEYLARRHAGPVRSRKALRHRLGSACAAEVPATNRLQVITEFELLWQAQQRFHPAALDDTLFRSIHAALSDEGAQAGGPRYHDRRIAPSLGALRDCMAALERRFGKPDAVVIEQAFPPAAAPGERTVAPVPSWGFDLLRAARLRPSRHRRLVLALMARQEKAGGGKAFCPYTGKALRRNHLFTGAYEVDHVVPVSRGGASTAANLVLCHAAANRQKGNRLPGEMDAARPRQRRPDDRVRALHGPCRPRFADRHETGRRTELRGAMHRLAEAARERIAARWPQARIEWAAPVAVAALRKALQRENDHPLFAKPLEDNRNHALDALLALHVAAAQKACATRILPVLDNATVTHAADSGGPATKETRYGAALPADGTPLVLTRRPLAFLNRAELRRIRDDALRHRVCERVASLPPDAGLGEALAALSRETGIRRVRIARRSAAARPAGDGSAWVMPSGNAHLDIVSLPTGEWIACGASLADIAHKAWRPVWEQARIGGKLVMRLRTGDMLELDGPEPESGKRVLRTVRRLANAKGRLYLAAPRDGGSLTSRHADRDDPFRWELVTAESLRKRNARALDVSPAGEVRPRRSNVVLPVVPVAGSRP